MKMLHILLTTTMLGCAATASPPPYYVAGDFNGWDPAGALMTETSPGSGIWQTTINVGAGRHEFKITEGDWDWNYPAFNSWLYAPNSGIITIRYDTNTHGDGWLSASQRIGLDADPGAWTAAGDFQGWDNAAGNMTALGGGMYRLRQFLIPGDHKWKAVVTGTWDSISLDNRSVGTADYAFQVVTGAEYCVFSVDAYRGVVRLDMAAGPADLGRIDFNNHSSPGDAPIYGPDPDLPDVGLTGNTSAGYPPGSQTYNGVRLESLGYSAQLFYASGSGQPDSALGPASTVTTFLAGTNAGYIVAVSSTLPDVRPGAQATIQIRAWDNAASLYPDWTSAEAAWQAGLIAAGRSDLFDIVAGGDTNPPAPLSNLQLSFNLYYFPPTITDQPVGQTVPAGQSATFTVGAQGLEPLTYQWEFNGGTIVGATQSIYTVTNMQPGNVGAYHVVVSDPAGSVTSHDAGLGLPGAAVWVNPSSGKWEVPGNWLGGVLPDATRAVYITNAGTKTVMIDATTSASSNAPVMAANSLTIAGGGGATNTLALAGAGTNALHVLYPLDLQGGAQLTLNNSSLQADGAMKLGSASSGVGAATVTNSTFHVGALALGAAAGGLGSLAVQNNAIVTVASNLTVVSGSLLSTSSIALSGGSLTATNTIIEVGPTGSGQILVSGGSHLIRQLRLGSTNNSSSGFLYMSGGSLRVLGAGTGPGAGLDANLFVINCGDLDGTGSSLTVGDAHSARVFLNCGTVDLAAMYLGYSPGFTGNYGQSGGVLHVSTNLLVGDVFGADCLDGAVGFATLDAGELYVTNPTHTAVLEVRNGTFVLNSPATMVVDNLIITNPCARFTKQGGAFQAAKMVLAPDLDADGDGQSNTNEIVAGTDPLDPGSLLQIINVAPINSRDLRLDWTSVGGHRYVVQATATPNASAFHDLSGVITASGTGPDTNSYVHLGGATNASPAFYRIRLVP